MTDLSEMPDSSKGTECAEAIAKLRSGKAMSQQDLADSLFVSRSLVAMWETGTRTPDSYSLERMAEMFGVEPGDILGDVRYAFVSSLERELIESELDDFTSSGPSPSGAVNGGATESGTERAERIIEDFFKRIGPRDREIFMNRYFAMKALKTVAEENGMSLAAVKKRLFKIRKKLKAFILREEKK